MFAWPLPALFTWALAWGLFAGLRAAGMALLPAAGAALLLGGACAWFASTPWRRVFMAAGFPLSLMASAGGLAALPAWAWLVPLGLLLLLYPRGTWGDAPLFPTPYRALDGLAAKVPMPAGAHILDAGCGLGDGLRELHREYPEARLEGLEWSWPLRLACALRCGFAQVRRADIWAADWSGYQLVYLFQRPESMPRAIEKACREMRPGSWVASLEFEAPGLAPQAQLQNVAGKPVWLYRLPFKGR